MVGLRDPCQYSWSVRQQLVNEFVVLELGGILVGSINEQGRRWKVVGKCLKDHVIFEDTRDISQHCRVASQIGSVLACFLPPFLTKMLGDYWICGLERDGRDR